MNTLPEPGSTIHIVGIGGVGMNGVAQVLQAQGYDVTGSDRVLDAGTPSPLLAILEQSGIRLFAQDGSGLNEATRACVVSTAVEADNPDRVTAQARGIPVLHRAQALAGAIGKDCCIAVAGTSGKTTVAGMLGFLLTELGWDPHVVNGGGLLNWKGEKTIGNVRIGRSRRWVVEVDESDRSLLEFHPDWAVITNISKDHFDLEESIDLFARFARQVGTGLVCGLAAAHYLTREHRLRARIIEAASDVLSGLSLQIPGQHNRENAALALTVAEALHLDREKACEALSRFKGIERRLERIETGRGVTVYDEYAHNTAKIGAAWTAIAETGARIVAIWRPHGYGPLAAMASDLQELFGRVCRPGDRLYVLPVYYAGGTANRNMTSEQFAGMLQSAGIPARYAESYEAVEEEICAMAQCGDAVLCMGARDPYLPVFARHLAAKLSSV